MNSVSIVAKPPSFLESLENFANESKPCLEKVARVALAILLVIPALLADVVTKIYNYTQIQQYVPSAPPLEIENEEVRMANNVDFLRTTFKRSLGPEDGRLFSITMSFMKTPELGSPGTKLAAELTLLGLFCLYSRLSLPSFIELDTPIGDYTLRELAMECRSMSAPEWEAFEKSLHFTTDESPRNIAFIQQANHLSYNPDFVKTIIALTTDRALTEELERGNV